MLTLACGLTAAGACKENGPVGPTVAMGQRFTLSAGAVAAIDRTRLRLQFVRVSGDSRCPADVVCIQGGDAVVHVRVLDGPAANEYELHTGDSNRARVMHGRFRIELVELQPYPFSSRTISPGEYRATLTMAEL
jgi:hypothetical protein